MSQEMSQFISFLFFAETIRDVGYNIFNWFMRPLKIWYKIDRITSEFVNSSRHVMVLSRSREEWRPRPQIMMHNNIPKML